MAETYEVVSSSDALDTSDVTNPVRVRVVNFRSKATGATGSVQVPLANLTPAVVDQEITKSVETLDAIHNL